jgi:hypothetical protein
MWFIVLVTVSGITDFPLHIKEKVQITTLKFGICKPFCTLSPQKKLKLKLNVYIEKQIRKYL